MLAPLDPAQLDRIEFPLGELTKTETRAEAALGRSRRRRAPREPGGVLPRRRRLPRLPGTPWTRAVRGIDRRRGRPRARPPRRRLALHARPAARHRRLVGRAAVRAALGCRDEHARRRPPRLARLHGGRGSRRAARSGRAGGREAPLPLRRDRSACSPTRGGIRAGARAAGVRRRAGPDRRSLRRRRRRRRLRCGVGGGT